MDYTVERLARDVAFEVNLGGDRFDREDVAVILDGVSPEVLDRFKELVLYHCEDFAPYGGYRDPDYPRRAVDGMCSLVRTGTDTVYEAALDTALSPEGKDRGCWFRHEDGSLEKCTKAVRWAQWRDLRLSGIRRVPFAEVLSERIRDLVSCYGTDGRYRFEDGGLNFSVGLDGDGRAYVNLLAGVMYTSAGGTKGHKTYRENASFIVSGDDDSLSKLLPKELKEQGFGSGPGAVSKLVDVVGNEFYANSERSVRKLDSVYAADGSFINLDSPVIVNAPVPDAGGVSSFRVEKVYYGAGEDSVKVLGRYCDRNGVPDSRHGMVSFPLECLTDAGVDLVRKGTEGALRNCMEMVSRPVRERRNEPAPGVPGVKM